jgi:pantothenate synthetase
MIKIGATRRDVAERLREANESDTWRPPHAYVVAGAAEVEDPFAAERAIHALLAARRVNSRHEFFEITEHDARVILGLLTQTLVVKRMVRDLGVPVEIAICPTIREPDGLAMSSRNAYLLADERSRAAAIHESLMLAERAWFAGDDIAAIEHAMRTHLAARGVAVDYAAIVDRESLEPLSSPVANAIAIIAGRLGTTRLIDNHPLPNRD